MPAPLKQYPWNVSQRASSRRHPRPSRSKYNDLYEPVSSVPDDLTWKPQQGASRRHDATVLFSIGNVYKLVRVRATGELTYYKLRDTGPEISPSETIDAEPVRVGGKRYRTGSGCWFVDTGDRWFLCEVVERRPRRIVIKSVTGWDAARQAPWEYGLLEFPARGWLFSRLRPLAARAT